MLLGGSRLDTGFERSGRYPVDFLAYAPTKANRNVAYVGYFEGIQVYIEKNVTDGDYSGKWYKLKPLADCTVGGNPATLSQYGIEDNHWEALGTGDGGPVGDGFFQLDKFTHITTDPINGSNVDFNLTYNPSFIVYVEFNGRIQDQGIDWNLVGQKVVMTTPPPQSTTVADTLRVLYTRGAGAPGDDTSISLGEDDFTRFNTNLNTPVAKPANYAFNKLIFLQIEAGNKISLSNEGIAWLEYAVKTHNIGIYRPGHIDWFATLQAAIDAAVAGETVHVYKDVTENITLKNGVNIDFHGHVITGTGTIVPAIQNTPTLNGTAVSCNFINLGGCIVSNSNTNPAIVIQGIGSIVNITGFRIGSEITKPAIEYRSSAKGNIVVDEIVGQLNTKNTSEVSLDAREITVVGSNDASKLITKVRKSQYTYANGTSDHTFYGMTEGIYCVTARTSGNFFYYGNIKSTSNNLSVSDGGYAIIMGDSGGNVELHKFTMIGNIECTDTNGLWVASGECSFTGNIKVTRTTSPVNGIVGVRVGSYGGTLSTYARAIVNGNVVSNNCGSLIIGNVGQNKKLVFRGEIHQTGSTTNSVVTCEGGELHLDANINCEAHALNMFNNSINIIKGRIKITTANKYIAVMNNVNLIFKDLTGVVNTSNSLSISANGNSSRIRMLGINMFNIPIDVGTPMDLGTIANGHVIVNTDIT